MTGLTPATITNITSELIEKGVVAEIGRGAADPESQSRKHRVLLDLKPDGAFAVGIHLGVRTVVIGVGDLRGSLLRRVSFPVQRGEDPGGVLRSIAGLVTSLLEEGGIDRQKLIGVGVSCAGSVHSQTGVLKSMHHHDWHDVPVASFLQNALQLPVAVESHRNAMAVAESVFGQAQKVDNFVVVHVGTTVVSGVVVDHRVYFGDNDASGQIAHLAVEPEGQFCSCGQRGCLDTVASEAAILRQAITAAERSPNSLLRQISAREGMRFGAEGVYKAAQEGDEAAKRIVREAATYLGIAIGQMIRILSPKLVIVAGPILQTGDLFMLPLKDHALSDATRWLGVSTQVVPTTFGADLLPVGALSLALLKFVYSAEPVGNSGLDASDYASPYGLPGTNSDPEIAVAGSRQ
jgi:predicted NBD/HSP70 family sugar kinase